MATFFKGDGIYGYIFYDIPNHGISDEDIENLFNSTTGTSLPLLIIGSRFVDPSELFVRSIIIFL